jgi:hypothetical protein
MECTEKTIDPYREFIVPIRVHRSRRADVPLASAAAPTPGQPDQTHRSCWLAGARRNPAAKGLIVAARNERETYFAYPVLDQALDLLHDSFEQYKRSSRDQRRSCKK